MENLVMTDAQAFQDDVLEQVKEVANNRKERRVMTSIVNNVIRKAKVKYEVVTVEQWIKLYLEQTDHQPLGQRLPVDATDDKSQSILESLICGDGVGQITMCDVKDHEVYKWESIDGGHRKRALRDFLMNKIPVVVDGEKIWFETIPDKQKGRVLTDEEYDDFMDIEISLQIFFGLTNEQKGKLFRKINDTSIVKEQEMLNSFGDVPAANIIRNMVRVVAGQNNIPHKLFTPDGNDIHRMKWLSTSNKNLKQEEFLAKVYFRFWDKRVNKCKTFLGSSTTGKDSGDLMDMYNGMTSKDSTSIHKDVKKVMDFLFEMSTARFNGPGKKLEWKEQITLTHFYLWMCDSFGKHSFKIQDYQKFYEQFQDAVGCYDADVHTYTDSDGNEQPIIDKVWNDEHESKPLTVSTNFGNYQIEWVNEAKIKKMVAWLVDAFEWDTPDLFVKLDKQRLYPDKMKETVWRRQGRVCYIDGKRLNMKDAEAAHIQAHSKGGFTTQDNIAMIRKEYNRAMGSMNLHRWMKRNGYGENIPV
jgi:hypothetical protein